ncbi:MAG: DUF4395 domain-containing protein [Cytophagaceae bacterium]|nr:DUF4395 domain-containing protein [Cytophagaceae bacterium]
MATIHCPTDQISVNEIQVRLTAGWVLLTTLAYLFTGWVGFPLLLLLDFSLRAFNQGAYSPFFRLSGWVVGRFSLGYVATDRAPKRFAAYIGLVFAASLVVLTLTQQWLVVWPLGAVLVVFAFLESVLGFCAGCYVYTFLTRWSLVKRIL